MEIINLALGKNATASSCVVPYAPSRAIDGSSTTPINSWLCNSVLAWLSVDLGVVL